MLVTGSTDGSIGVKVSPSETFNYLRGHTSKIPMLMLQSEEKLFSIDTGGKCKQWNWRTRDKVRE